MKTDLSTRYFRHILAVLIAVLLLVSCNNKKDIIVLYDNDVHCYIDIYTHLEALKDSLESEGHVVYKVSAGDFLSGGLYGNLSHGESIIELMNAVGYDAYTIGNHEFDFGMETFMNRIDSLNGKVVCCNFKKIGEDKQIFESYARVGPIAFIGVITATTLTTSSPKNFEDENGNYIYSFCPNEISKLVQKSADEARKDGAEYVIVLSHLGDKLNPILTSTALIENTRGIDAVLDGHEHNVIECRMVDNIEGKPVVLTSTGAFYKNIGILNIKSNGKMVSHLRPKNSLTSTSPKVDSVQKEIIDNFNKTIAGVKIGTTEADLSIMDYAGYQRVVRSSETNIGDLITDAFRIRTGATIALINSGSVRDNIKKGEITYSNILSVCPFENHVSVIEIKGEDLLNALEMATSELPKESGGFLQVSGIRFDVDTRIKSSIIMDSTSMLTLPKGCERRVKNVQVFEDNQFINLDPEKKYTVAGIEYILLNKGDGISFNNSQLLETTTETDAQIISDYIVFNLNGQVGQEYARPDKRINIIEAGRPDSKTPPIIMSNLSEVEKEIESN